MKSTPVQFLGAVLGSVCGFFVWLGVFLLAESVEIDMGGGCKGVILVPILIGVPFGCTLGIALVEKVFHRGRIVSAIPALMVSGLFSISGVIFSIYLMDEMGGSAIVSVLFAPGLFAVLGYRAVRYLTDRRRTPSSAA